MENSGVRASETTTKVDDCSKAFNARLWRQEIVSINWMFWFEANKPVKTGWNELRKTSLRIECLSVVGT